jgi:ATP-binding cassette subfamily B protein
MAGGFGGGGGGFGGGRFHFSDSEEKPNITKKMLIRIAKYFIPYWKLLILLVLSIIITSTLGLIPPLLTKNIIDVALPTKKINLLILFIVLSFGATLLSGLISVGQSYLNSWISKHIMYDLRNSMFNHLQYMSIRFFSNVQAGEITSRMNNDIGGIENIFSGTFVQILQNVFVFASTAAILFYTNWKLALVGMLILPLFIAPTRKVGKVRWKIASQTQGKLAELNTILHETLNIGGTMLVKLFTKEKHQQEEFQKVNKDVTKLQIKESLAGRWFFMTISTFVSVGPMIIYLVGGIMLIHNNEVTVGGIVMFVALLGRLYGPVTSFANISVDITRSFALFDRIFGYFDMEQEIVDSPNAAPLTEVEGAIKFTNVSFAYNEHTETLKDINIDIKPGKLIAFVGSSGAGKTTITYLLPRLYDISSGSIAIDGKDIREVTIESLRSQIGMVTQDTYLFNATIRQNLLFSKTDATDEELISACKTANIHELIASLPEGYDTIVGERGIKLSGGEKQRLSIARALLKNPRIVILDEATSALDSVSESLIQAAIEPLLKGRTSLVIAHRLSTIMAADCIYVVDGGQIIEQGTHEELLSMNGIYKDLCDKQFKNHKPNA